MPLNIGKRVLCIGDVMLDVVVKLQGAINYGEDTPSKITTHGGGAAGNVASWIAHAGTGASIVARVGNDSAGAALISEFHDLKVDHSSLKKTSDATGVVVILVDQKGERTMFPETGANSGLSLGDMPALDGFDAAYISGYALLNPLSRPGVLQMISEIKKAGLPIFYDTVTVGAMKEVDCSLIHTWLPLMDYVLPNEEEALYVADATDIDGALKKLLEMCPAVIIKRGAQGACAQERGGNRIDVDALATVVADTTGAGDSFAGGFIAAKISGRDLRASVVAGVTLAATCVANIGARPQGGHAL
jgi:sugar/nucleoside kinase (ribokinase family)